MLGVSDIQQYEKYLGLPSLSGQKKKEGFTHIKQQVWKKISRLGSKTLITSGKRDLNQIRGPSSTHLHNDMLQTTTFLVP